MAIKGITTENTFLMHGSTKLVDIKEFPDLGGAPSTVEITTLTDHMKTYLNGLVDPGSLEFNANYTAENYDACMALYGKQGEEYAVWFGIDESGNPDGHLGKFEFEGQLSCWVKGGGTEAAVDLGIAIAPSTDIVKTSA